MYERDQTGGFLQGRGHNHRWTELRWQPLPQMVALHPGSTVANGLLFSWCGGWGIWMVRRIFSRGPNHRIDLPSAPSPWRSRAVIVPGIRKWPPPRVLDTVSAGCLARMIASVVLRIELRTAKSQAGGPATPIAAGADRAGAQS